MEKIVCEVCGGEIIKKSDGTFQCQNCGNQLSDESIHETNDAADKSAEITETANNSDIQSAESIADNSKTDNSNTKKAAIFVICFIAVIGIIGIIISLSSGNEKTASGSVETEYDTPVYSYTNTTTTSTSEAETDDTEPQMSKSEFEDMIEEQLSDLDYVEVGFRDGNVFTVGFCFNGTAAEIGKIQYGISDYSFWRTTKVFVNDLYKKIKSLAEIYGFEDYSIGINVINDMDHSKSLLVSLNGNTVYDCLG